MEGLSKRQQQVYGIIKDYYDKNGFSPSLADIARMTGLSESTVATYVEMLKRKGVVTSQYRVARSLRAVESEGASV